MILEPGTHDLHAPLATRAHVRIEAYGAEIVNRADSHLMHVDDNGGGGYDAPGVVLFADHRYPGDTGAVIEGNRVLKNRVDLFGKFIGADTAGQFA